jgi:hypothetical protein
MLFNSLQFPITLTGGLNRSAAVVSRFFATNGVLFIIDSVLAPPMPLTLTANYLGLNGFKDTVTTAQLYTTVDSLVGKTLFILI